MRPVPVPDYVRRSPWVEDTQIFGPPEGVSAEQLPPVEGLFYTLTESNLTDDPVEVVGVVLELEDDEVAAIRDGGRHILISWPGRQVPVFLIPSVLVREKGGR